MLRLRACAATVALILLTPAPAPARGPLDPLLGPVLTTLTPVTAPLLLPGLTPEQLGQLLENADPAQLTTLLGALSPAQLEAALATLAPGSPVIGIIQGLLAAPGPAATATPAPTTTPPVATVTPAPATPAPAFTAYRARITKVKVARNRRSAKVTLVCPATAPVGCAVTLAGKKVSRLKVVLAKGAKRTTRVGLKRGVGRSLTVKATTATSTLAPATKKVRTRR